MSEDLNNLDWNQILQPEKKDANLAFDNFQVAIDPIINNFMPLEKVNLMNIREDTNPGSRMAFVQVLREEIRCYVSI